ncbi:MAG: hypothetical protein ACPGU7_12505 [Gammaproteobacteria bacterium]
MLHRTIVLTTLLLPLLASLQGCATAVVAGASAAGGYYAHDKGYRVQNPVVQPEE